MAQYSVGITTLLVGADSKTTRVYGLLYLGQTPTNWPAGLTSVALQNGQSITSVTATTETIYDTRGQPTTQSTFGALHSGGSPVPWSPGSIGLATSITNAPPSSSAPTPTSASSSRTRSASTAAPTEISLISAPTSTGSDASQPAGSASSPISPPSTVAVSSPSPGVSSGAAAGIAIGCLLIGLALGLLAAFLLVKRHGKRHGSAAPLTAASSSKSGGGPYLEPEAAYNASDKASASVGPRLDQFFLLQATPDRTIVQETRSISALIDEHVEGHYSHDQPLPGVDAPTLASALAHLGFPLPAADGGGSGSGSNASSSLLDAQEAAALCLDPRSRRVGLRHIITRVLLDSIDVRSPRPSLLPAPVATFLRAMPAEETDRFGDPQANALALREWRRLSAFLLHPSRSQRTALPADDDAVAAQARDLAASLNGFLSYFVEERPQQQVGHLRVVIEECARLGCLLFSHPSDWEFVYETGARGVVVEAGLCKLQGRDGAGKPCPEMLIEPVVVSL